MLSRSFTLPFSASVSITMAFEIGDMNDDGAFEEPNAPLETMVLLDWVVSFRPFPAP